VYLEPQVGCCRCSEWSSRPSIRLGNVEVLDLGEHLQKWRDVRRDVGSRSGTLCHALAVRVVSAFAGCKGRRELSKLLSNRLANVVIVDDESHVKKPKDVASLRSGILCYPTVSRSGEMVAKPSEKVVAAAAVLECAFCRP
jgi:hypothetical protein